jgi:hypothetical protein
VNLFSYVLGYSRRQYLHFTPSQDLQTTIRQHVRAFEHLGGVAATCLYDDMKAVVSRYEDGEPIYNTRFLAFATHYGFLELILGEPAARSRQRAIERRIRDAKFHEEKNLRDFDWKFNAAAIDRAQIEQLATGEFVRRGENLVMVRPRRRAQEFSLASNRQALLPVGPSRALHHQRRVVGRPPQSAGRTKPALPHPLLSRGSTW